MTSTTLKIYIMYIFMIMLALFIIVYQGSLQDSIWGSIASVARFIPKEAFLDYNDLDVDLVYRTESEYQTIELVKDEDRVEYCLILNGQIQNHSIEAIHSHNRIVDVSIKLSKNPSIKKMLILGGGDGYPAMFALRHNNLHTTNVELDGDLVNFTKSNPVAKRLTEGAFENPKLNLIVSDAYKYIYTDQNIYDIIIHDIELKTDQTVTEFEGHDFYIVDEMLSDTGVLNYTEEGKGEQFLKIHQYCEELPNKSKYDILLFTTQSEFSDLSSFFLFDTIKFKEIYPNSEIGILTMDTRYGCGDINYGIELSFYISKSKFDRSNKDIYLHEGHGSLLD